MMSHVILKNGKDRVIGVGGEVGNHFPVACVRKFVAPATDMSFYVDTERLDMNDLTPNELEQYRELVSKMPDNGFNG